MAFAGLHVVCAQSGTPDSPDAKQALLRNAQWSETLASAGTTTNVVGSGSSVIRVRSAVDAWVAIGPAPDAAQTVGTKPNSARFPITAATDYDFYANVNDKLAWVTA